MLGIASLAVLPASAQVRRVNERTQTQMKERTEVKKEMEQNTTDRMVKAIRAAANSANQNGSKESSNQSTAEKDKARREAINKGFSNNIGNDNAKALTISVGGNDNLPAYIEVGSRALELVREEVSVNSQSDQIFAANYENIYPGAIVFADQSLADGDPTLAFDGGTVDLRVNFNTGNRSHTGVLNNAHSINDEIGKILEEAKYSPSPNLQYKSYYSSSLSEMAIGMKVNAKFLSVNAKVDMSTSKTESHVYETQDYTQEYYTVSITQHPTDQSLYFADNVTWEQIANKIRSNNNAPLAIITSVTYGRRAYKFYDYSTKDFKFKGSEEVQAYGQTLSSTQDIAEKSETKNVWMYLSGGDTESSGAILKGDEINTAISSKLKFNVNTNQGVPLYYTVRFIASGRTANVSTTGKYYKTSYRELPGAVEYTFRNNCTHVAGAGFKMRLDYKVFRFDSRGQKQYVPQGKGVEDGYSRYTEHEIGFGNKKTGLLDLQPGEYIEGPLRLQIRCKTTSNGKWHNDVVCRVVPTNGVIDVDVHGAIRPGGDAAYIYSKSKTQPVRD